MRLLIQRTSEASVEVEGKVMSSIGKGLVVLIGIEDADTQEDIEWLSSKLLNMRLFDDADGVMNLSLKDVGGKVLLISQFTLHASTKKGNRPSYIRAAKSGFAQRLYDEFIDKVSSKIGSENVGTGVFGADMKVKLINDGPVTIFVDSKNKE